MLSFSRGRSGEPAQRRALVALTSLFLLVASLALVTLPSGQPAYGASASLAVSPATYVGGQRLTWTGNVGAPGVRSLALQFHMGRPGDTWTTVAGFGAKTRADGSFSFAYPAPGMFNIRYRVKAGSHVSPSKLFLAKTQDLTLRVTGQRENNSGTPALVPADEPFGITVDTTPDNIFRSPSSQGLPVFPGRTLTLQRRIDGDTWRAVATTKVGDDGLGRFTGLTRPSGVSVFRVREEDYRQDGNEIGWTQSFPLFVYVGTDAWAQYDRQQLAARATPSLPPGDSASFGSGAPTPTASERYGWYPLYWDFAWEHGQSLTGGPARGTRPRGHWVDYVDGAGRVSKQNGQLALDSKRFYGAGPGDFGSTRATLTGNAVAQGRWEARMRIRGAYETGGRAYGVRAELVPEQTSGRACNSRTIEIASISPFSRKVRFGARSAKYRWSGAATASATPLHSAYAVAVEVAKGHITWFLDGKPVGSVTDRAAFPGVPMTLRLTLTGQGREEMNQVSLVSDWQRGFPLASGRQTISRDKLKRQPANGC
ncbi:MULTISPECIES: hypothetical protein [unclassified Nocardioides]|uniref:hypothetical protein n=1 Tax=unclassified Nocardioides TaxID=2615069 RepID=UPI0000EB63DD|nr:MULTISPECIES: hypothetical protein [unclassified Nocardioides]ABL84043.1 hypothetical protein Noca_4546 [Nocardioides sp. JS614]